MGTAQGVAVLLRHLGHVAGAEEPHEASLFDMDAKYADVAALDEVIACFARLADTKRR